MTFGYPQRWATVAPLTAGRPATRRYTGGGIVEHGDDLTLTLAVPAPHPVARLRPAESYRLIHEAVRSTLLPSVPGVRLATGDDARPGPACFTAPACLDLLWNGRKILGGAQRRTRHGLLYQGSLQNLTAPDDFPESLAATLAHAWKSFTKMPPTHPGRYADPAWNQLR
ncbi:MAG: hypothetical protein WA771_06950 [Chthoniobacterales bacterium]